MATCDDHFSVQMVKEVVKLAKPLLGNRLHEELLVRIVCQLLFQLDQCYEPAGTQQVRHSRLVRSQQLTLMIPAPL